MQDKDAAAIVASMSACIGQWYIAAIDYPRAMSTDDIQREVLRQGQTSVDIFTSVTEATRAAVAQSGEQDRVVVFGSFHVVGPALEVLT